MRRPAWHAINRIRDKPRLPSATRFPIKTNKPIGYSFSIRRFLTMKIIDLLTTSKGWIIRQAAKLAGIAGVWLAAKASAAGAVSVNAENATAAVTLILVGAIEIGLSFAARKNK